MNKDSSDLIAVLIFLALIIIVPWVIISNLPHPSKEEIEQRNQAAKQDFEKRCNETNLRNSFQNRPIIPCTCLTNELYNILGGNEFTQFNARSKPGDNYEYWENYYKEVIDKAAISCGGHAS